MGSWTTGINQSPGSIRQLPASAQEWRPPEARPSQPPHSFPSRAAGSCAPLQSVPSLPPPRSIHSLTSLASLCISEVDSCKLHLLGACALWLRVNLASRKHWWETERQGEAGRSFSSSLLALRSVSGSESSVILPPLGKLLPLWFQPLRRQPPPWFQLLLGGSPNTHHLLPLSLSPPGNNISRLLLLLISELPHCAFSPPHLYNEIPPRKHLAWALFSWLNPESHAGATGL